MESAGSYSRSALCDELRTSSACDSDRGFCLREMSPAMQRALHECSMSELIPVWQNVFAACQLSERCFSPETWSDESVRGLLDSAAASRLSRLLLTEGRAFTCDDELLEEVVFFYYSLANGPACLARYVADSEGVLEVLEDCLSPLRVSREGSALRQPSACYAYSFAMRSERIRKTVLRTLTRLINVVDDYVARLHRKKVFDNVALIMVYPSSDAEVYLCALDLLRCSQRPSLRIDFMHSAALTYSIAGMLGCKGALTVATGLCFPSLLSSSLPTPSNDDSIGPAEKEEVAVDCEGGLSPCQYSRESSSPPLKAHRSSLAVEEVDGLVNDSAPSCTNWSACSDSAYSNDVLHAALQCLVDIHKDGDAEAMHLLLETGVLSAVVEFGLRDPSAETKATQVLLHFVAHMDKVQDSMQAMTWVQVDGMLPALAACLRVPSFFSCAEATVESALRFLSLLVAKIGSKWSTSKKMRELAIISLASSWVDGGVLCSSSDTRRCALTGVQREAVHFFLTCSNCSEVVGCHDQLVQELPALASLLRRHTLHNRDRDISADDITSLTSVLACMENVLMTQLSVPGEAARQAQTLIHESNLLDMLARVSTSTRATGTPLTCGALRVLAVILGCKVHSPALRLRLLTNHGVVLPSLMQFARGGGSRCNLEEKRGVMRLVRDLLTSFYYRDSALQDEDANVDLAQPLFACGFVELIVRDVESFSFRCPAVQVERLQVLQAIIESPCFLRQDQRQRTQRQRVKAALVLSVNGKRSDGQQQGGEATPLVRLPTRDSQGTQSPSPAENTSDSVEQLRQQPQMRTVPHIIRARRPLTRTSAATTVTAEDTHVADETGEVDRYYKRAVFALSAQVLARLLGSAPHEIHRDAAVNSSPQRESASHSLNGAPEIRLNCQAEHHAMSDIAIVRTHYETSSYHTHEATSVEANGLDDAIVGDGDSRLLQALSMSALEHYLTEECREDSRTEEAVAFLIKRMKVAFNTG